MNSKFYFLLSKFCICISILLFSAFYFLDSIAFAATNIDSTYRYAWNDVIGWIDFYQTLNVNVTSTQLTGYATSSVGFIALDCATSPTQDCTYPYKVSNNGSGNLTGWAYNDVIGWISFDSGTATSSYPYQVNISTLTGDFSGWAWNDIIGWISFCGGAGTANCPGSIVYKVKTSWTSSPLTAELTSSIFDTGVSTGVAINTIMWQGDYPAGTIVEFQIASGATSTPASWTYRGPDGSSTTFYRPTAPGNPVQINSAFHTNHRCYRYKVFLTSNASRTLSPRVDDVIINWSP